MKKFISVIAVCAMLTCSMNLSFAYGDTADDKESVSRRIVSAVETIGGAPVADAPSVTSGAFEYILNEDHSTVTPTIAPTATPSSEPSQVPTERPLETSWKILSVDKDSGEAKIFIPDGTPEGTAFTLIMAKYKNNVMLDCAIESFKTETEGGSEYTAKLGRVITSDAFGEEVKLMLWDGTDGIKPLAEPYTLKSGFEGEGTEERPYLVTSARQLDSIRENLNACYRLENDIDLTEYLSPGGEGFAKWGDKGWQPIRGVEGTSYELGFDGAGHVISGLYINRPDEDNVGLFGGNASAVGRITADILHLGVLLSDKGITGGRYVGGIIGSLPLESEIRGCGVSGGSVKGNESVGGIAGSKGITALCINCNAKTDVSCGGGYVGGIFGRGGGYVVSCAAEGSVFGVKNVGGVVGELYGQAGVNYCSFSGSVTGVENVGGIAGMTEDGGIIDSFCEGEIVGENYAGGIVGLQGGLSRIKKCASKVTVSAAADYAGGIAGAQISPPFFNNKNILEGCTAEGEVSALGEHRGAVSGYFDDESAISDCSRMRGFTVNGAEIPDNGENSAPSKIDGGITETNFINDRYKAVCSSGFVEIIKDGEPVSETEAREGEIVTVRIEEVPGEDRIIKFAPNVKITDVYNVSEEHRSYCYRSFQMPASDVSIGVTSIGVYPHIYDAYVLGGDTIVKMTCIQSGVVSARQYDESGHLIKVASQPFSQSGFGYYTVTLRDIEADVVYVEGSSVEPNELLCDPFYINKTQ